MALCAVLLVVRDKVGDEMWEKVIFIFGLFTDAFSNYDDMA